jgi:hypothetical protein
MIADKQKGAQRQTLPLLVTQFLQAVVARSQDVGLDINCLAWLSGLTSFEMSRTEAINFQFSGQISGKIQTATLDQRAGCQCAMLALRQMNQMRRSLISVACRLFLNFLMKLIQHVHESTVFSYDFHMQSFQV